MIKGYIFMIPGIILIFIAISFTVRYFQTGCIALFPSLPALCEVKNDWVVYILDLILISSSLLLIYFHMKNKSKQKKNSL